jgi:hypothetical protein
VSGTVTSDAPTPVVLKIQRREGKHWTQARIAKVRTRRNGKFRKRFRRLAVGHYRVLAHSTGRHRGHTGLHRQRFVVR